jgi:hypothetical protein
VLYAWRTRDISRHERFAPMTSLASRPVSLETPARVSHPPEREPLRAFAIACIIVLAALLRVWGLRSQSLTMDEIADISSASQWLGSVIHVRDGFPPLYGLLVHGWLAAFPGEATVRWLSVILGVLSVPAIWRLGVWAGGERVGQLAALALAISPFHRWISQEARAYVLYVLLAIVALWLFFRAMSTNARRDWALYALTSAAGVYSHYFFGLLPLVAGLLLLFERRTSGERARGVWANVALAAACVPAIGLVREDMAYQASYLLDAPFSVVTAGYAYFSMIAGFAIGPSLRELHSLSSSAGVRAMLPWALAVGGATLVLLYVAVTASDARRAVVRLAVFATAPIGIGGALAAIVGVGFRVRYFAWVAIPVIVLIAIGLASARFRIARLMAAATLLIVCAISTTNRVRVARYWNEDVQGLRDYLRSASAPSVPVFVTAKYMAVPVQHYLGAGWTVCALPDADEDGHGSDGALRVVNTVTLPDSEFWLVYSRPFHSDPRGLLPRDLASSGPLRARHEFAGITLYGGIAKRSARVMAPLTCRDPNPAGTSRGDGGS